VLVIGFVAGKSDRGRGHGTEQQFRFLSGDRLIEKRNFRKLVGGTAGQLHVNIADVSVHAKAKRVDFENLLKEP